MSDFEDRVTDAAGQLMTDRYKALAKLDQRLADAYALEGADGQKMLREGKRISGRIIITLRDAELIWSTVADNDDITMEEEEALCIIIEQSFLNNTAKWQDGARFYIRQKIEQNLKRLWSAKKINANQAATFIALTKNVDFESKGTRHKGTGIKYTPQSYDQVLSWLRKGVIGAWEIPNDRGFRRTPMGLMGEMSRYDSDSADIYLVAGEKTRQRAAAFVHEATHAFQDIANAISVRKYTDADAYIAEAAAAHASSTPYSTRGNFPENVASGGAAQLLLEKPRGKDWAARFRDAYDAVVDAVIADLGPAEADKEVVLHEAVALQRQKDAAAAAALARIKARTPRYSGDRDKKKK